MSDDLAHMRAALALARRGLGNAWPNPAVGCVLVRHGQVVGRGWTQPGGRPHAETEALKRAGSLARGASGDSFTITDILDDLDLYQVALGADPDRAVVFTRADLDADGWSVALTFN